MTSLRRHTINILSALPLTCLDVLLSVHVDQALHKWEGVNMDCVHTLLLFMDRRLNRASVCVLKQYYICWENLVLSPEWWILMQKKSVQGKDPCMKYRALGLFSDCRKMIFVLNQIFKADCLTASCNLFVCVQTSPTYLHVLLWQQHRNQRLRSPMGKHDRSPWCPSCYSASMKSAQSIVPLWIWCHCYVMLCEWRKTHTEISGGSGLRCFCWNSIGITLQITYKCSQLSH